MSPQEPTAEEIHLRRGWAQGWFYRVLIQTVENLEAHITSEAAAPDRAAKAIPINDAYVGKQALVLATVVVVDVKAEQVFAHLQHKRADVPARKLGLDDIQEESEQLLAGPVVERVDVCVGLRGGSARAIHQLGIGETFYTLK